LAAYVHLNLRVIDPGRQAALMPRFMKALADVGGRLIHFGRVAKVLEGEDMPLPFAGVLEFSTVEAAVAFYESPEYASVKAERALAQEARIFVVEGGSTPIAQR
jgi:uncharacterized protein (DUF1330 family)